jgi:hypothetical protein
MLYLKIKPELKKALAKKILQKNLNGGRDWLV